MPKKKRFKVNKIDDSKIEIIPIFKKNEQQPWKNYDKSREYIYQCNCKELRELIRKIKEEENDKVRTNRTTLSNGKLLPYQDKMKMEFRNKPQIIENLLQYKYKINFKFSEESFYGQFLKTFQLSYQLPLSRNVQIILNSFKNKYIYYAIDDILCLLDSDPNERDNLLQILYSCMLSLHNEFSINFFDIWIDSIYFNDNFETNRFLKSKVVNKASNLTISIKLHYFKRMPIKKPEPIW